MPRWNRLPALAVAPVLLLGLTVAPPPAGADGSTSGDHTQVVDITFPTDPRASYSNDFDSPRSSGAHHATDVFGEKGWPVHAAVGGTITWIPGADGSPMPSYGYMITIAGDDGREYHYVHLNNDTPGTDDGQGGPGQAYARGLQKGSRVARGQHLGWMGDSGNAESTPPHLHFEIEDPGVTDPHGTHYINPWYSLEDARRRGDYPDTSRSATGPTGTDHACPQGEVPDAGFADVTAGSTHDATIDCAVWWQVARGLDESRFGPDLDVTRAQMATFVARLLRKSGVELPQGGDHFDDDDGHSHEASIDSLAGAGVVGGSGGLFHPDVQVSRAQMASLLVRAVELAAGGALPAGPDAFRDDDGDTHEANIDKAAAAGVATGFADGRYRPSLPVTRAQMATFLARGLDALVEDGHARPPT